MAFIGSVEDRLAIRELYGAYGDASSRADAEAFLACWADDGQWNTHLFSRAGKKELKEQWDMLWMGFDKVAFLGDVAAIEVDGDRASARVTVREIVALKGGGVFKLAGLYRDELVRQNGQWLFAARDYSLLVEEAPGS
jgi:uncharacterized protein (TIGR02246 family)